MKTNPRPAICMIAMASVIGIITGGAVQAVASPLFQEHQEQTHQEESPDYSKNKTFQQGMREGQNDRAHNQDHSKKRHFKKDADQQAYEAGYQKGRGN